jgi:hypothetical protein
MNRKVFFAALALGLAVFGSLTARAQQPDPLEQLFKEGWVQVAPGILQRDLGPDKAETLGFGAEGLRWKLKELRKHLAYLQAELAKKPTNDLRKGIRNQRAEINRVLKALRTAKSAGDLSSATAAASAGIDCTIKYGAHVNAFYTTNAQGVGATSDAYFNSNCGQIGEVYAHSHGKARGSNGVLYTQTKHDPPQGQIRSGVNVSANGSITPVYGVSECYSYSYASMTSYDLGVVYSQSVDNSVCPQVMPPLNLAALTSNYGNSVSISGYNCATVSWTASPSGGTTPYTYSWTANTSTTVVGTGQTYSKTFCGSNTTTTGSWKANVTVRDSSSPQQSKSSSHTITINYYHVIERDPCGTNGQICP